MGQSKFSSTLLNLSKSDLLKRAEEFIFSTGINDGASKLCKANMKYGLAQFHLIQEKYGFEPKAMFISSPDETISRNLIRWESGLGYGGRISWGNGNQKIIFLNTKPNQCGILAGGLEEPPDPYDLIKKIDEIKNIELYYDQIKLKWDYGISNHFINCFKTYNLSDIDLPPYLFFIHGSAPELRDDTYGIGFYFDKSKTLKERAIEEETIFGKQYILLDDDATEFLNYTDRALEFSMVKREMIAEHLFGKNIEVICNQPHQFLKDYNNMYLGSNCTDISSDKIKNNIFPITLRADLSAYLFKGKKNLSEITIKNLRFLERANKLNLLDTLLNADILPHGGGYKFPDIKDIHQILEYKYQKYFSCSMMLDTTRYKIIRDPSQIEYEYRGREVVLKTLQLDLGENLARLNPIFSLKL
ncbi:MAG: hypothetical protein ACFFBP_08050 [Promethearchaeota archaeon]